jgi:hypothetical protein
MVGTCPNETDMVLDSVSIYVCQHGAQVRVAVYQGGSPSDPEGATLIEDFGVTTGTHINQWLTLMSSSNPALAANTLTWLVIKGNDGGFKSAIKDTSGEKEDFSADGIWVDDTISSDEATAYPSAWPATGGSYYANYWHCIYLTYSISAGGGAPEILRVLTSARWR